MQPEFTFVMRIKHECGSELMMQGWEWPPKVVVCTNCKEIMGLSNMKGESEAKFVRIGSL